MNHDQCIATNERASNIPNWRTNSQEVQTHSTGHTHYPILCLFFYGFVGLIAVLNEEHALSSVYDTQLNAIRHTSDIFQGNIGVVVRSFPLSLPSGALEISSVVYCFFNEWSVLWTGYCGKAASPFSIRSRLALSDSRIRNKQPTLSCLQLCLLLEVATFCLAMAVVFRPYRGSA